MEKIDKRVNAMISSHHYETETQYQVVKEKKPGRTHWGQTGMVRNLRRTEDPSMDKVNSESGTTCDL